MSHIDLGPYIFCKNSSSHHLIKYGFTNMIVCNGEESWDFMKWAWTTFGAGMTLSQIYTSDVVHIPSNVTWVVDNCDFYIHESISELIVLAWS